MDENMNEYPWYCVLKINPFAKKDDIKEIKEINDGWDLIIIFKNGDKFVYEVDSGYFRRIFYRNLDELTEEQERKEFGYALRTLMRRKFITQEELAKLVGTSQAMISYYMTGRYIPNYVTARRIARVLGCSMEELSYIDYNKYLEE